MAAVSCLFDQNQLCAFIQRAKMIPAPGHMYTYYAVWMCLCNGFQYVFWESGAFRVISVLTASQCFSVVNREISAIKIQFFLWQGVQGTVLSSLDLCDLKTATTLFLICDYLVLKAPNVPAEFIWQIFRVVWSTVSNIFPKFSTLCFPTLIRGFGASLFCLLFHSCLLYTSRCV